MVSSILDRYDYGSSGLGKWYSVPISSGILDFIIFQDIFDRFVQDVRMLIAFTVSDDYKPFADGFFLCSHSLCKSTCRLTWIVPMVVIVDTLSAPIILGWRHSWHASGSLLWYAKKHSLNWPVLAAAPANPGKICLLNDGIWKMQLVAWMTLVQSNHLETITIFIVFRFSYILGWQNHY